MERLIIDDTTVYEIDEECEKVRQYRKEREQAGKSVQTYDNTGVRSGSLLDESDWHG